MEQKYNFFGVGSKGSFRPILGLHGPLILQFHQYSQNARIFLGLVWIAMKSNKMRVCVFSMGFMHYLRDSQV